MLQKSKSKTIAKFKYLVILPLMLGMLTIVSCTQDDSQSITTGEESLLEQLDKLQITLNTSEEISAEEKEKIIEITMAALKKSKDISETGDIFTKTETVSGADIPFAVIEEVPIYPGCENLGSNDAKKKCMSEKIQEHVQKNFNISVGKELGLTGQNRVIVQFKINKNGEIVNVKSRASHPKLEEEAKRVINAIPTMIPGKQSGKEVGVMYSLPIVFQVNE